LGGDHYVVQAIGGIGHRIALRIDMQKPPRIFRADAYLRRQRS
jgi:hypothetical protein